MNQGVKDAVDKTMKFFTDFQAPNEENREAHLCKTLQELRDHCGATVLKKAGMTRLDVPVAAGAKGSYAHVNQSKVMLGQTLVNGQRITTLNGKSTPHFTPYDTNPKARGFVASSFHGGLDPQEMFFHGQGGREGLVDTSAKTAEVGYSGRAKMKAMEDICVRADGSVCDTTTTLALCYGEDGLNSDFMINENCHYLEMSSDELKANLDASQWARNEKDMKICKQEFAKIKDLVQRSVKRKLKFEFSKFDTNIKTCIHFEHLLAKYTRKRKEKSVVSIEWLFNARMTVEKRVAISRAQRAAHPLFGSSAHQAVAEKNGSSRSLPKQHD